MSTTRAAISRLSAFELAAVAAALLCAFAPIPPAGVEQYYSVGMFPVIQRLVTAATNLLPIAVMDVMLVAVLGLLGVVIVGGARQAWRTRSGMHALRTIGHLAAASAVLYVLFLIFWGFNYRRVPMAARVLMDRPAPSSNDVLALGMMAVDGLNSLNATAHRDGTGTEWRDAELRRGFAEVQQALSDAPLAEPGRPKRSLLGFYFRWAGVDGMINPFGLEVLANPDLLPFERAFVTAHEWGHLAGYADESDANFVGWLTCMHGSPAAQYSGWFFLYWQISSELDAVGRERLAAALGSGPREDVRAVIARLQRDRIPALQRASWQVYDQYLKANRVEAGVRSYGAVVNLILRARFDDGWTPLRRVLPDPL